jgi:hypothetical protein
MRHDTTWGTEHEVEWLRGLGLYTAHGAYLGRPALLRGYLDALSRRMDWRGLDRDLVRAAAEGMLAEALGLDQQQQAAAQRPKEA